MKSFTRSFPPSVFDLKYIEVRSDADVTVDFAEFLMLMERKMKERKETKLNDGQWWSWSCDANDHRNTSAIRACRTCELPLQLSGGRLAMSARAKERAKDAPPILREKELPPSASNPSAAMNVGKDEAQLMGMEGRAARLAAKTPTSKH